MAVHAGLLAFCYDGVERTHVTAAKTNEDRTALFLRACRGEAVERVPVWIMRQAGRYLPEYRAIRKQHSFLEVCKSPALAAEVSLQPYRILDVDAVIVFSDILIPAEAMGMELELSETGPVLGNPVRQAADVDRLRDFDPEVETRFVGDAIRLLRSTLGPAVPVIGFAAAPWTLACYMVEGQTKAGFASIKRMLYAEPAALRKLLERIARATARYLDAQIAAGAAVVQLFDTWAGELSREDYEAFALPATQLTLSEMKSQRTPTILYTKASAHLLESVVRAGADVLGVDWRADLAEVKAMLGGRGAVQGNVDPCMLLGPADGIGRAVRRAIEKTGGAGHILNLGHGILPGTPVENARAFVAAAREVVLARRAAGPQPVSR
jgi:uroporphyrinogen decarboxylase